MTGVPLVRAMKRKGWTTQVLADKLGVTYEAVSSWRQARRSPCCPWMRREMKRLLKAR